MTSRPLGFQGGGILTLIGLVVVTGVLGTWARPENATQVIGFCSVVAVTLLGIFQGAISAIKVQEVADQAKVAAVKVEEVKTQATAAAVEVKEVRNTLRSDGAKTAAKLKQMAKVMRDTHTLVNNNMEKQLKITAIALRRVAENGDPDDIAAAVAAEELLAEHVAKQRIVDSRKAKNEDTDTAAPDSSPPVELPHAAAKVRRGRADKLQGDRPRVARVRRQGPEPLGDREGG